MCFIFFKLFFVLINISFLLLDINNVLLFVTSSSNFWLDFYGFSLYALANILFGLGCARLTLKVKQ